MRREAPIIIVAVTCLLQIVEYFFTEPTIKAIAAEVNVWGVILSAFSLGIGVYGTTLIHIKRVQRRTVGFWYHSIWFIGLFSAMVIIGLTLTPQYVAYQWLYNNILSNLWQAMLGTTGFFIIYAAYRAFRARSTEAALMLTAGVFTLFKNMLFLRFYWEGFYSVGNWIFQVPQTAASRALTIGASIGMVVLALRVLLGYERAFLGIAKEEGST